MTNDHVVQVGRFFFESLNNKSIRPCFGCKQNSYPCILAYRCIVLLIKVVHEGLILQGGWFREWYRKNEQWQYCSYVYVAKRRSQGPCGLGVAMVNLEVMVLVIWVSDRGSDDRVL